MRRSREKLERYAVDCASLRDDLDNVISDAYFELASGTNIYALDNSEIYQYLFAPKGGRSVRLFSDDKPIDLQALERAALNTLIFETNGPTVALPEPYWIEFTADVDRIHASSFESFAAEYAAAKDEFKKFSRRKDYSYVRSIAAQHLRDGRPVSPPAFDRLTKFFEINAPKLLTLLESSLSDAHSRLQHLLTDGRLRNLDELLPGQVEPDTAVTNRFYRLLARRRTNRPPASSYIDARALALIKAANERFRPDGYQIRLVTRSTHMLQLFEKPEEQEIWHEAGGSPLRRVRSFGIFDLFGDSSEETIRDARMLRNSLETFLDSYGAHERGEITVDLIGDGASDEAADMFALVDGIRSEWRRRASLRWTISHPSFASGIERTSDRATSENLSDLLRLVWSEQDLNRFVKRRVTALMDSLQQDLQLLGLQIQGHSDSQRKLVEDGIELEATLKGGKSVLSSKFYYVPYTLQFYGPAVGAVAEEFERAGLLEWERILQLFRSMDRENEYEVLLFVAYVFANLDRWYLAETYSDLALDESTESPKYEGWFFKAVCLNRRKQTPERYRRAVEALARATTLKRESKGEPDYQDPRYLKEEAYIVFDWNRRKQAGEMGWSDSEPPPEAIALEKSQQALSLIADDVKLPAQIYNNLAYFFLMEYTKTPDDRHLRKVRSYLDRLHDAQERIDSEQANWSPAFLDTLAWGRWQTANEGERALIAEECRKLLLLAESGLSDRDTQGAAAVRNHRSEIDDFRRARNQGTHG